MDTRDTPVLDPDVYRRNLESLSQRQPHIARQISSTEVAESVVLTVGRDGSPTFRIPVPNGKLIWLGFSSMPTISSPALLADFNAGNANALLPSLGHGEEAKLLLNQLKPHQAVFTWDPQSLVPTLALRLHDFSNDILAGRLILAIDPSSEKALSACFEDYPTHLPPTKIFSAPQLKPADVHQLQTGVEAAANKQHQRLADSVVKTQNELAECKPTSKHLERKLAILSMVVDPLLPEIAGALGHAAGEMDIACMVHIADRPERVHILSIARLLLEQKPSEVLLLDQVKGEFGPLLDCVPRSVSWCVSNSAARPELVKQLAADESIWISHAEVGAKIKEAGGQALSFKFLGPAADPAVFRRTELAGGEKEQFGSDVAVILDAASLSPEAMGLQWDTHKKLVKNIIDLIKQNPQRLSLQAAEAIIDKACRQTRFTLDAGEVRRDLANLMCRNLAPTLTILRLIPLLASNGFQVKLWGRNWGTYDEICNIPCFPAPTQLERNKIYNACRIVLHLREDFFSEQHLVDALAAGACVLRQGEAEPEVDKSCSLLDVWQAVPSFTSVQHGAKLVRSLLENEDKRRSALLPAHSLVQENHLMRHRLATLRCI